MKFKDPKNPNYAATVVTLSNISLLDNCHSVVATTIFGNQAIIGAESKIGDRGIVFPAEVQLSEAYCKANNLFRHKELNEDQTKTGYIEDNRRVKAVKFRGHTSSCLFMPFSSLKYLNVDADRCDNLKYGDTFDEWDGEEVCRKYEVASRHVSGPAQMPKQKSRVDAIFMPEHIDTENFWKNSYKIPVGSECIITQKIHGTSVRIGNTVVNRKLSLRDRIAKLIGVKIQETEHAYVFGSRKVIKDVNNSNQNHYYGEDIWCEEGKKLEGLIPENFLVYAELIGYTASGKPIQVGYTYDLAPRQCALYVYRVAFINPKGLVTDLSWEQVKRFCRDRGIKHVPELAKNKFYSDEQFHIEDWIEARFKDRGYEQAVPLSNPDTVDEGVCIRVDGMKPLMLKAKSQAFLRHETALLDKQIVDIETQGTQT